MKRTFLALAISLIHIVSYSQIKALTENGKEVLLYNNGTWKYSEKDADISKDKQDTIVCNKPENASFSISGEKIKYKQWFDPKKWNIKKETGTPRDYMFTLKDGDAYVMVIAEGVQIPLESMKDVVLANAQKNAPDCKIVKEEIRIVNGKTLKCIQMEGSLKGIYFVYLGYYYSDSKGTVQLISFTGRNLFSKYKSEMERFLNGFSGIE